MGTKAKILTENQAEGVKTGKRPLTELPLLSTSLPESKVPCPPPCGLGQLAPRLLGTHVPAPAAPRRARQVLLQLRICSAFDSNHFRTRSGRPGSAGAPGPPGRRWSPPWRLTPAGGPGSQGHTRTHGARNGGSSEEGGGGFQDTLCGGKAKRQTATCRTSALCKEEGKIKSIHLLVCPGGQGVAVGR